MTDTLPQTPNESEQFQSEWCRVALASIGEAVIATDTEGRVVFLNSVAESLVGWTQDEAVGISLASVFKMIDPESHLPVESPVVLALRDGASVGVANHTLLRSKDSSELPVDDSAALIRGVNGQVVGVVMIFRDVSERQLHENAIQEALSYADNIITTLPEPFIVLDKSLRVRTANRAFYQVFRVESGQTEGHLVYDLGDGQWNIPGLQSLLIEVLSSDQPVQDYEVEHDFPGLGHKTMLLNARRFPPESKNPHLILLAIQDITARKRAEAIVHTSEVRYRRLFQTAKDGILILDANTMQVLDANPFMTDLLGYSFDEFVGRELWEIGFFADKRASQAAYRELHEQGYIRYDHLPLETKTGERAEVEFVCNTYQVDGKYVAQCNIRDIGERSRLEKKTHEQATALTDLHRRKDEFLAMLSHELRNPLAPIANAVQLLRLQPNEDPLQQQARAIIERQVTQLTRLVDDLMEVSRITTGRVQLRQERVTLNGIVTSAVESARPLINRHQHELVVSVPTEPIWLYADAARLEQVVVNLLNNSAKYTRDGGRIELTVAQEGDECVVRVQDTGVGIAPELLPRIFDLFTQAERSLDRSQGGLGIGLALVQRLVELHRGRVEAMSVLGQGSELIIYLPVLLSAAPSLPPIPIEAIQPAGPSLRVMVVDDNVDAAESLGMLLKAAGHNVRISHEGPTALKVSLEFRPDVMLLDIGLPGMNGYEVAKQIRKQAELKNIMLIALTGYGEPIARRTSVESGFDHHLVKPADFTKVRQLLATVLVHRLLAHNILVVDDRQDATFVIGKLLEALGQNVRIASDGKAALDAARIEKPELVISDISMPGMDGYELVRQMKATAGYKDVVCVALTGNGDDEDRQRAKEAGFDQHLVKPVSLEALRHLLLSLPRTN